MNAKTWVPLALAVVLGLAAAMVARQMLLNRPAAAEGPANVLRTVVVANDNILPGTEILPSMLITAKVSAEMAPEDTFNEPSDLAGRVAQAPIYKGQPLLGKLLAPKGSPGGFGTLIPPGMRAITIEVNEFSGVAGFLTPGSRVDVLATVQGDKGGEMLTQTVVQNVMVTAVGQRLTVQREGREEPPFRSVTLIASPEEAQAIELAAATSRPRLVLRNQRDDSKDIGPGVTLSDIRGSARAKSPEDPFATSHVSTPVEFAPPPATQPNTIAQWIPPEPPARSDWTIKVIRGGSTSEVTVPLPAKKSKSPSRNQPWQVNQPAKPPVVNTLGEPLSNTDNR
jgi:pilus assembly protein CpaB